MMERVLERTIWTSNAVKFQRPAVSRCCFSRGMAITSRLHTAKPSRTIPKKLKSRPLDYKSPVSRAPRSNTSNTSPEPGRGRGPITTTIGGISLFLFASGFAYLFVVIFRADSKSPSDPSAQIDVSKRYDAIARSFDSDIDSSEYWMGIKSLRQKLVSVASGDVLEVSIGTGRNIEFYDWNFKGFNGVGTLDFKGHIKKGKVTSFTAVDMSPEMLEVAHEKFGKLFPGILGVRWVVADASSNGAIPGPPRSSNERSGNLDKKYDTIVQTMGLCSVSDPVRLLKNLGECVEEEKGRIFLLEHGRGRWRWLNKVLDQSAEGHAKQFGCWWNRDLNEIVEKSGLEVVKFQTPKWWHGGTTKWIELKKPRSQESQLNK